MVLIIKNEDLNFSDYPWHDAILKNIKIDRGNPGTNDTIVFEILWPDEEDVVTFVFEEVYWAELTLNFGIVTDESIFDANELNDDNHYLADFYFKWNGLMDEVKLKTYKIELNSTGGEINIIAKAFRVVKK